MHYGNTVLPGAVMKRKTTRRRSQRTRYSTRLTSKYQATVPKEIRQHLHLESGDRILYEVLPDGTVVLRKTSDLDRDYLEALNGTMNEWLSEEDEQAYKDL